MKIAHFNSYLKGGAAIAARRLHDELVKHKIKSIFYSLKEGDAGENYIQLPRYNRENNLSTIVNLCYHMKFLWTKTLRQKKLKSRPSWLEPFSFPKLYRPFAWQKMSSSPDVFHLHWVANFIDYPSFFGAIPNTTPIVWTLHDMNPFTGGCHYSWECSFYKNKCGNCFQLGRPSKNDLSHKNLILKHECIKDKNLHIVADSHWLESEARTSYILSHAKSFRTIHYGIDHLQFCPKPKRTCKKALGIHPDKFVIAFGAESINNKRKGIKELISALNAIERSNFILLLFGPGKVDDRLKSFEIVSLGAIESELLLSTVYSAADLFIIPSLHEAFGQTSLEAMACGTPVVGFDTGGIPDMIKNYQTGLLAETDNEKDLACKIRYMIDNPLELERMGRNARDMVEKEFKLIDQANNYINLYDQLFY